MNREAGFIAVHRKLRSSALYQSLTAEQRSVFIEVLLACNWRPSRMLHAGKWVEIDRGEFADSLETIARRAAVSVKVVRTTYAKLLADDSHTGGNGPFMTGRWSGTKEGTGLRILRVVRYDEFQRVDSDEGTSSGTAAGMGGARQGQASGTAGAPSEPREPDQPPAATRARAAGRLSPLPTRADREAERWPCSCLLAAGLADAWEKPVSLPKAADRDAVEDAVRKLSTRTALHLCRDEADDAIERGALAEPPDSLGWFAKLLVRAAAAPPAPTREPGAPPKWGDPDFDDPAAWPDFNAYQARSAPASAVPITGPAVRSAR